MLAKEVKINNLKQQREFIRRQLEKDKEPNECGETLYRYFGYILPENIEYFKKEGYDIKCFNSEIFMAHSQGVPMYAFTIREDIILNNEELKEAEAVEVKFEEDRDSIFFSP